MNYKHKVLATLGLSADAHAEAVFETGCAFALHFALGDDEVAGWLTHTQAYWDWYSNQFDVYDGHFLSNAQRHDMDTWNEFHCPDKMLSYPGRDVLKQSYAEMIGKQIDEVHGLRKGVKQC